MLSPKQIELVQSTAPVTLAHGSIRSGKTLSQCIAYASWVTTAPAGPLAIIGVSRDTINRNILAVFDMLHPGMCEWSRHSSVARIMGRETHLISANDAKAESKIRGLTLAGALLDEATLIPEAMFVQLLGRLSVKDARLFVTTNPDSPAHWLRQNYILKDRELGWDVIHFTMADNPGLSPEYVAAKAREFTGLWYRRFIEGEWVTAEGAVFPHWDHDRHVIDWAELPEMRAAIGIGLDYGTTNATSAVAVCLGVDGCLYAVDEYRVDQANRVAPMTDGELSAGLQTWLARPHTPGVTEPFRHLFIDPAAASFKAQLARDGVHYVRDADHDVLPGIQTIAHLIANGRLKVANTCTGLISELPGYSWDSKASTAGKDKPIKVNDHSVDALRYALHTTAPWWRNHVHT